MSDTKPKATVDDIVQELRWLNQNVVASQKTTERHIKQHESVGKMLMGLGCSFFVVSALMAWVNTISAEQGNPANLWAGFVFMTAIICLAIGLGLRD